MYGRAGVDFREAYTSMLTGSRGRAKIISLDTVKNDVLKLPMGRRPQELGTGDADFGAKQYVTTLHFFVWQVPGSWTEGRLAVSFAKLLGYRRSSASSGPQAQSRTVVEGDQSSSVSASVVGVRARLQTDIEQRTREYGCVAVDIGVRLDEGFFETERHVAAAERAMQLEYARVAGAIRDSDENALHEGKFLRVLPRRWVK